MHAAVDKYYMWCQSEFHPMVLTLIGAWIPSIISMLMYVHYIKKHTFTLISAFIGEAVVVIDIHGSSTVRLMVAAIVHPKKEKIDSVGTIFMINFAYLLQ